jgi:hypothetical protein
MPPISVSVSAPGAAAGSARARDQSPLRTSSVVVDAAASQPARLRRSWWRNRPVLDAPLEFLQAETKLAPDQFAKHSVIMIGMVKCEKNLLRKPQRLAHDRPHGCSFRRNATE